MYMDRKMKRWELALMCGVLCALALGGWLDREQERLADQVIRLHVIANSDSPEDQALKLEVRDQVLAHAEELYPAGADRTAAAAAIQEHLPELAAAGQRVLEERGCDYAVRQRPGFPPRSMRTLPFRQENTRPCGWSSARERGRTGGAWPSRPCAWVRPARRWRRRPRRDASPMTRPP